MCYAQILPQTRSATPGWSAVPWLQWLVRSTALWGSAPRNVPRMPGFGLLDRVARTMPICDVLPPLAFPALPSPDRPRRPSVRLPRSTIARVPPAPSLPCPAACSFPTPPSSHVPPRSPAHSRCCAYAGSRRPFSSHAAPAAAVAKKKSGARDTAEVVQWAARQTQWHLLNNLYNFPLPEGLPFLPLPLRPLPSAFPERVAMPMALGKMLESDSVHPHCTLVGSDVSRNRHIASLFCATLLGRMHTPCRPVWLLAAAGPAITGADFTEADDQGEATAVAHLLCNDECLVTVVERPRSAATDPVARIIVRVCACHPPCG